MTGKLKYVQKIKEQFDYCTSVQYMADCFKDNMEGWDNIISNKQQLIKTDLHRKMTQSYQN